MGAVADVTELVLPKIEEAERKGIEKGKLEGIEEGREKGKLEGIEKHRERHRERPYQT